jgi:hypothetical protein
MQKPPEFSQTSGHLPNCPPGNNNAQNGSTWLIHFEVDLHWRIYGNVPIVPA